MYCGVILQHSFLKISNKTNTPFQSLIISVITEQKPQLLIMLISKPSHHKNTRKADTDLLDEVNGGLEVKAEVDELPVDAFAFVLLLFQHKHCVVEELLQLFVRVVDAQLLE